MAEKSIYSENNLDNQLFVEFRKSDIDKEKIRLLIGQGANINAVDKGGWNILWNYIVDREDRWEEDFRQLLLEF